MESANKMKLTYTNVNGYLNGFLRRDYLKNHKNSLYQVMILQDTIGKHLLEVDKAAEDYMYAETGSGVYKIVFEQ